MQSIFRLPWYSDHMSFRAGDKDAYAPPTPHIEMAIPKQTKRKRAISSDSLVKHQSSPKKRRPTTAVAPAKTEGVISKDGAKPVAEASKENVKPSDEATDVTMVDGNTTQETVKPVVGSDERIDSASTASVERSSLQQAIENQLNLQILLKHNELRLIDQELAKCQIALEQLRRCEIQPYPGHDGFDYSVSTGTGPAVISTTPATQPEHAAPYGVVDGPYTRHYRRWLLHDDEFDSRPIISYSMDDANAAGRSTRHAGARKSLPGTVMAPSRQSADYSAMPVPAPKRDCSMPLVLRRSTDSKLVKLVCNNCNRGNMSSIQGFLNHCRIAHKVVYESHDAAALDCGRPLDDAEIASLPAESQSMPVAKPTVKHAPSRAPTIVSAIPPNTSVHPLNTPGAVISQSTKHDASKTTAKVVQTTAIAQPAQFASTPFKAAASLPKLSAIFAQHNAGGDLEHAVNEAKRKSDFSIDEVMSPASLTPGSPASTTHTAPSAGRRTTGGKGTGQSSKHRLRQSYFAPASTGNDQDATGSPHEQNYSPHTVYSNPGLVSDVEDDDNASASEEETAAPHHHIAHPLGMNRGCAGDVDISVAEEDALGQHGVVIRRNSLICADDALHADDSSSSRKISSQR